MLKLIFILLAHFVSISYQNWFDNLLKKTSSLVVMQDITDEEEKKVDKVIYADIYMDRGLMGNFYMEVELAKKIFFFKISTSSSCVGVFHNFPEEKLFDIQG